MQTDVHIAVATSPEGGGINLEHDIRLVKAALLYADRVTLCSATSAMVLSAIGLSDLTEEDQIRFVSHLAPVVSPDNAAAFATLAETYTRLNRSRRRTRDELILLAQMKRTMKTAWDELRPVVQRIADDAGAADLQAALASGLVDLYAFQHYDKRMTAEFLDFLKALLADRQRYPLLDEGIGQLVKSGTAEGVFSISGAAVARGRHAALAGDLLARLPMLDHASIDEIVDIRRELEGPLVRFRSAVARFSDAMEVAAWDDDFAAEAEAVFIRDVAPAVSEIEEAVASNIYLVKLLDRAIVSGLPVAAFGVLIANAIGAAAILQAGAGAIAPALVSAWEAYRQWEREAEEIQRNQMFFYYRAEKALA